jgi:hypothetical protein
MPPTLARRAGVASLEPSSTTMTSNGISPAFSPSERRQASVYSILL